MSSATCSWQAGQLQASGSRRGGSPRRPARPPARSRSAGQHDPGTSCPPSARKTSRSSATGQPACSSASATWVQRRRGSSSAASSATQAASARARSPATGRPAWSCRSRRAPTTRRPGAWRPGPGRRAAGRARSSCPAAGGWCSLASRNDERDSGRCGPAALPRPAQVRSCGTLPIPVHCTMNTVPVPVCAATGSGELRPPTSAVVAPVFSLPHDEGATPAAAVGGSNRIPGLDGSGGPAVRVGSAAVRVSVPSGLVRSVPNDGSRRTSSSSIPARRSASRIPCSPDSSSTSARIVVPTGSTAITISAKSSITCGGTSPATRISYTALDIVISLRRAWRRTLCQSAKDRTRARHP